MKIKYIPNYGFQIHSKKINWDEKRKSVREKLKNQHKEDDNIIEMAKFFDGDTSYDLHQRRDIYKDINGEKNFFFFNYDKDGKLSELEVHWGVEISIKEIELKFKKDISNYIEGFEQIGEKYLETEKGNYFFENLKMVIATSESMGGEGNGLTYFYSAKNIGHLIKK